MNKGLAVGLLYTSFFLASCQDEDTISLPPNTQEKPSTEDPSFVESTWIISKVQTINLIIPPEFVTDTLKFINSTELTYNGIQCEYSFYPSGDLWYFELKQTPRFIGSINTFINREPINYGKINQQEFVNVYIRNQKWLVWMEKNN